MNHFTFPLMRIPRSPREKADLRSLVESGGTHDREQEIARKSARAYSARPDLVKIPHPPAADRREARLGLRFEVGGRTLPQPSSCSSAHLSARIRATLASLITPTAKASPSGCEAGERAAVAGPGAGGGLRDRACRRRRGGRRRSIRSYLLDSAVSRRRASRASTTEVCSSGSACRHRSAA